MDSTFLGIEIGKRSLLSHRKALNVVGHNLSNSNNEKYSRQRIIFNTSDPLYRPQLNRTERPGQLGQGVEIAEIRRVRDIHLDNRIYEQQGAVSYWTKNKRNLQDIESVHNALGETNLQQKFDKFWQDWQDLSLNPSEPARRSVLVDSGMLLTRDIRNKFETFNALRLELNERIIANVEIVNNITSNIAALNNEIVESQAIGDNPNDMLDERDAMIEDLSKLVDITVDFRDPNELMVYVGGKILVQGDKRNLLVSESDPNNEGLARVYWEISKEDIKPTAGEIYADLTARDTHLVKSINDLDIMANNLMFAVNEIHREGFNSYGRRSNDFFKVYTPGDNNQGQYDLTSDGTADATLIYELRGNVKLQPKTVVGSNGTISLRSLDEYGNPIDINVDYFADDHIEDVLEKLNLSEDSLNFYLNFDNKLTIKSRSNTPLYPFAIPYLADSGDFLSSIAGVLTPGATFDSADVNASAAISEDAFFNRTPVKHASAWIAVHSEIENDHNLIATRGGVDYDGVGGRDAAYGREETSISDAIARIRYDNTLFENKKTFNEFYINMIADISTQIKSADYEEIKFETLVANLQDIRQSVSGVNIDEEMSNMIAFQQGYEAGARIVKIMDEILQTLLGLV